MSAADPDRGAQIAELVDRHYNVLAGGIRKDNDCHWWISERWAYGRHAGWVIEHNGHCYDGLEHGEDGPFPTREVAGFFLLGSLAARNVGASVGVVLITLVALIFLVSPQSIESLAKGIAETVF